MNSSENQRANLACKNRGGLEALMDSVLYPINTWSEELERRSERRVQARSAGCSDNVRHLVILFRSS